MMVESLSLAARAPSRILCLHQRKSINRIRHQLRHRTCHQDPKHCNLCYLSNSRNSSLSISSHSSCHLNMRSTTRGIHRPLDPMHTNRANSINHRTKVIHHSRPRYRHLNCRMAAPKDSILHLSLLETVHLLKPLPLLLMRNHLGTKPRRILLPLLRHSMTFVHLLPRPTLPLSMPPRQASRPSISRRHRARGHRSSRLRRRKGHSNHQPKFRLPHRS